MLKDKDSSAIVAVRDIARARAFYAETLGLEMPGVVLRGNVHHMGPMRLVWLKDPDGNILHLNNRSSVAVGGSKREEVAVGPAAVHGAGE